MTQDTVNLRALPLFHWNYHLKFKKGDSFSSTVTTICALNIIFATIILDFGVCRSMCSTSGGGGGAA